MSQDLSHSPPPSTPQQWYTFRYFLANLVSRDLKLRYQRTLLGLLWAWLDPLFKIGIYTVLFAVIFKVKIENYPIFLLSALLPWAYFQDAVAAGQNAVLQNRAIVRKTAFPHELLAVAAVLGRAVHFVITFALLIPFLFIFKIDLGWSILLILPLFVLQTFMNLGVVLLVSSVNVRMRDAGFLVVHATRYLFYLTPILYPASMVPERFKIFLYLNPMAGFVEAYRQILFYGAWPDAVNLIAPVLATLMFLSLGWLIFKRLSRSFGEWL